MPNRESDLVGVTSDYDGTSIAEIFVLADQKEGAVKTPVLVSSTPAEGSTDASANGSIILNFDAKVKAGTGNAILNGEEIAPVIAGKSTVFKYAGLDYATQYTFQMPKGVLVSRSGEELEAVSITFTTMERQQPEKRVFDAIVAQDGSGDYTTVQDAIDAAPEGRGKHESIEYNESFLCPTGRNPLKIFIIILGSLSQKYFYKDACHRRDA